MPKNTVTNKQLLDEIIKNRNEIKQNRKKIELNGKAIEENTKGIEENHSGILYLTKRVNKIELEIDDIKKTITFLPKAYDNMDILTGEIIMDRKERAFLKKRLDNHELRLENLESTALVP